MRNIFIHITFILAVSFMVVSCRHKDKTSQSQPSSDSAVSITTHTSSPETSDDSEKSASSNQTTSELQMQSDTAPRTDWRASARKNTKIYSPALLTGVWKNGNLHQLYRSDGTGLRWDVNDDVDRTEGLAFSWVMDSNCLTMLFPMRLGGVVPKEYLVTYADDESLVYKDAYGTSYMWDKVPEGMERIDN